MKIFEMSFETMCKCGGGGEVPGRAFGLSLGDPITSGSEAT
jgi:hypothetical protein